MTTQEQLVGEMIEMVSEMRSCVRIMRSDVADMRHVVTRPGRSACPVCGGAGSCSRGWFECGACDYEGSC